MNKQIKAKILPDSFAKIPPDSGGLQSTRVNLQNQNSKKERTK